MSQNKKVINEVSQNRAVNDTTSRNSQAVDVKPNNKNPTLPIETEQQYEVIYGAGQWMGMYAFTYKDGGTVISLYSQVLVVLIVYSAIYTLSATEFLKATQ